MLETLKRQVLDHRASVSASTDLCNLTEDDAILRLTGYLGNSTKNLLPDWPSMPDWVRAHPPRCRSCLLSGSIIDVTNYRRSRL